MVIFMPTHNALEHSIHFGQLYASAQSRDGDLAEFYAHAMQSFLHILSDFDNLHLPDTESDFLKQPTSVFSMNMQTGYAFITLRCNCRMPRNLMICET